MEKTTYRGGRPEMSENNRSDIIVKVRFNETEYKRLIARKSTTLSPDLSKFIRHVCLDKPLPMKTQLDTYQDEAISLLVEMRADLLRVGININQSAKRINSVTDYRDLQRDVNEMATNVNLMTTQMQRLLNMLASEN